MIATRIATAIAGAATGLVLLSAPSALAADPVTAATAGQTAVRPGAHARTLPCTQTPGRPSSGQQAPSHRVTPPQSWAPSTKAPSTRTPHRHAAHTTHTTHTTHVKARVVSHRTLNIRSGPGTGHRVIGSLRPGSTEHLVHKVNGSKVDGNKRWYKLADRRGYVAARYVRNLDNVPWR